MPNKFIRLQWLEKSSLLFFENFRWRILFIGDQSGMYGRSINSMLSIIHEYLEGESITDTRLGQNLPISCFSRERERERARGRERRRGGGGAGKSIDIRIVDWFIESKA